MSKAKQHPQKGSDSESVGFHRPYWKSAHKDWRLWIAVGLMFVAMFTYFMTGDLAWRSAGHPQQPPSSASINK
jgi:hypothetical protein